MKADLAGDSEAVLFWSCHLNPTLSFHPLTYARCAAHSEAELSGVTCCISDFVHQAPALPAKLLPRDAG